MSKLRYIIRMSLATLYSITIFSFGIFLALLRPFNPNTMYLIGKMLSWRSKEILGVHIEHRGVEHLDQAGPVVYMSNHQDTFDVVIGSECLRPNTVLIGKKALILIPFFGVFFWLSGNFLINRKNKKSAKQSMLAVTKKVHEENVKIWILPEGTRSRGRGFLPFKKGGFITAIDCQIPIVPVVWSSYVGKLDFSKNFSGKVISSVLAPIETKGLTHENIDELLEKVHRLMSDELKNIDHEAYGV